MLTNVYISGMTSTDEKREFVVAKVYRGQFYCHATFDSEWVAQLEAQHVDGIVFHNLTNKTEKK